MFHPARACLFPPGRFCGRERAGGAPGSGIRAGVAQELLLFWVCRRLFGRERIVPAPAEVKLNLEEITLMASQALSPDQSLGRLLQEIGLEGLLTIGAPVGGEGDWTTITLEQLDDKIIHSAMGNFPLHRWFDGLGHAPVVFLEKDGTRLHL